MFSFKQLHFSYVHVPHIFPQRHGSWELKWTTQQPTRFHTYSLLFLVVIYYITICLPYHSYYPFFPFSSLDSCFLQLEAILLGTYMFRIIITDSHFYCYKLFLFTVVFCKEVGLNELVHHSMKSFKINSGDTAHKEQKTGTRNQCSSFKSFEVKGGLFL